MRIFSVFVIVVKMFLLPGPFPILEEKKTSSKLISFDKEKTYTLLLYTRVGAVPFHFGWKAFFWGNEMNINESYEL